MTLKNDNGLFMDEDSGRCVGYLFDFQGRGVFSPDGKVDVTKEQADTHNRLLSEAEVKGLDENCQVGQYGTFYYINSKVQTFVGVIVAQGSSIRQVGKSITFERPGGKVFRGRLQKDADCFNFKRIK